MIVSSVAPPIKLVEVRPHRDAGLDLELDAVLGHGVERLAARARVGAVDHLRIDARLHGLEHVAAGQVDGRGPLEVESRIVLALLAAIIARITQRHVAAGQVVGLERLAGDAGLFASSPACTAMILLRTMTFGIHLAERHAHQIEDADAGAGRDRLNPEPEVAGEDRQERSNRR